MIDSENANEKKFVKWVLDGATLRVSDDSVGADREKRFSFDLIRYKDLVSHGETLTIKCKLDGKDNGAVDTNIYSLDRAFNELKMFGVVLDSNALRQIQGKIEEVYLDIEPTVLETGEDDKLTGFLEEIGQYISMSEDENTEELCYIPVADFDSSAMDCGYQSFALTELRRLLSEKKYIRRTSSDRFSTLVRYKGKPTRVITFFRESMKDYIPEKKEKNDKTDKTTSKKAE